MKKICFILFLILPLSLFSQNDGPRRLALIFSLKSDEFKALVTSPKSQIKISNEVIGKISEIIEGKKEEYFIIVDKCKKSVTYDENGKPIGKADPELLRERGSVENEVCTSIYEILGEKRYRQLSRTLIDEAERRNAERLSNAMKNKK